MITHEDIDVRIYKMVEACAGKIDSDVSLLTLVRRNKSRIADERFKAQWFSLLERPWPALRELLLNRSCVGDQLRQNAPFGGILTEAERMSFFPASVPRLEPDEVLRRTR